MLPNGFRIQETPDGLAYLIIGHARKEVWESMRMSIESA